MLADGRGRVLAGIGLALFLLATAIWVLQIIFAATVTITAADQTASSGAVPPPTSNQAGPENNMALSAEVWSMTPDLPRPAGCSMAPDLG